MVSSLVTLLLFAAPVVVIVPDSVKVEGPHLVADVTARVEKQLPTVAACVPEAPAKDVTLTLKLTVMSDGQVSRSGISGGVVSSDAAVNDKFTDCVTDAADSWKFTARKVAGVSQVRIGLLIKAK